MCEKYGWCGQGVDYLDASMGTGPLPLSVDIYTHIGECVDALRAGLECDLAAIVSVSSRQAKPRSASYESEKLCGGDLARVGQYPAQNLFGIHFLMSSEEKI